MIELYRASAGSGKTYTLAKKYIWYFLTISQEGGKARLRTDAELADSARHILAVTFTNKATNEMQMRIVDSLFALANQQLETKTENGVEKIVKPVYMQDFVTELGVSPQMISAISAKGLAILLENYSEFNVSTIDSFFQQVLRTFAYESEINDSYQVELDSEYLSQVGVDATFEEIDNNSENVDTPFWIREIMKRTTTSKWNIFSRSVTENGETPYMAFIGSVKKMETEQYKVIRNEVEQYFRNNYNFREMYLDLCKTYEKPVRDAHRQMCREFAQLSDFLPKEFFEAHPNSGLGRIASACNKIRKVLHKWNMSPKSSTFPIIKAGLLDAGPVKAWIADNPVKGEELQRKFSRAYGFYEEWVRRMNTPEFLHWRLYSKNLPYFALFGIVTRKRQEYLDETNAIELGETSMIINGVIGDHDAPFIYERMGTRLNHFLIDEFQDTSKMQWENMSPLLSESLSKGNGNLIIGDAKQSIYRFRNADPSLIQKVVPRQFGKDVVPKGNVPAENTNYRSDRNVVEFNNDFFSYLVAQIDGETGGPSAGRMDFSDLYANVSQTPNRKDNAGYVEISFYEGTAKAVNPEILSRLPELVKDMLSRGYCQKDIAVLVSSHREGDMVIGAFADYNSNLEKGEQEIRFISEQSLKLSSSRAVNIIVDVLANMARGSKPKIRKGEEGRIKGAGNWYDMVANFKFYQMQHPNDPLSKVLEAYFNEGADFNALTELLGELQSYAIPALVEALTAVFVSDSLRTSDAIYIAAFQDLVLDYCDSHPTDIGSFLKWWERKSASASVSSPEETDAVQVVTVHKSKGLEYGCVIVPFANWDMGDKLPGEFKKEWLWVKPEVITHPELPMPVYLPIETSDDMRGTVHEPLLNDYFDVSKMDRINAAYVAFTRAEHELYIFCTLPGNKGGSGSTLIGSYLKNFMDAEGMTVSRGVKPEEFVPSENKGMSMTLINSYDSVKAPDFLKYVDASLPRVMEGRGEDGDEVELDPRSEGNIKHAVLEMVEKSEDLPKAIRHLVVTGIIPETMAPEIESSLADAIARPEVRRWFEGRARVINERPVLRSGYITRRPDRLMIFPDGHAEVVDYKFGKNKAEKYKEQITRYVNLLKKTGNYKDVKGYLWYINENEIQEF